MQGMLVAMSMGMLSYRLYTLLSGQQASDRPQDWVKEGLARSAMTGWFNEANNTLAKFTAGKVDYNRVYGRRPPAHPSHGELPAIRTARADLRQGGGLDRHRRACARRPRLGWRTIHQARMALAVQNLMGARILFDQAEDGVSSSLGFKPRDRSPRQWAPGPTPYPS